MVATGILAFTTLFAAVGPIDVAALYAALTARATIRKRHRMAAKAVLIATTILLATALFGTELLRWLGVTLPALRIAGGILLLLIALDMVFARHSGVTSTTEAESEEAETRSDISVFPIATPLIAGPGAMGATILRMAEAHGQFAVELIVIAALLAVMAATYALLIGASWLSRILGVTGLNVITRVMGVLLASLAVQFMIDGITAAKLLG
ncbi:MAG TPA: MarC family protein [Alphaproteobacteria bacterium]